MDCRPSALIQRDECSLGSDNLSNTVSAPSASGGRVGHADGAFQCSAMVRTPSKTENTARNRNAQG